VFLGTPHRGADLATILNGLLNVTYSKTKFVKDLSPTSQSIKEINDSFAEQVGGLTMASFWESTGVQGVGVCFLEIEKKLTPIRS
jgi:hypothetical protein